ncbi:MAG TPA: hypothetical protein VND68_11960 [Chloroflexia bacterium]|jgi:hypothetical protein|nr:hypothetical protein [Chloroflexia bacterium]
MTPEPKLPSAENTNVAPGYELEYKALRDEIIKRIEFIYQTVTIILIVAGTFLSVGTQPTIPSVVLLIYPVLAFLILVNWAYQIDLILQTGRYIRENIERVIPGLGWETYQYTVKKTAAGSPLGSIPTGMLVLATQCLATILALLKLSTTPIEVVMLAISLISIGATVVLTWFVEKKMRR